MPIGYAMAIQSTLEVFAFITILIGFANEDKIKAWEHKQWLKIAHKLYRLINRKDNKANPQKGRKRANNVWSQNWEPKYTREDFEKEKKQ